MRTTDLIDALSADAATPPARLDRAFGVALLAAAAAAAVVFMITLGPRADFMDAMGTLRFPFKFVLTAALGAAAAALALGLSRPGASLRPALVLLGVAAALLGAGVAAELLVMPQGTWLPRTIGGNAMVCLVNVPLIAALPLGALLYALRRGAPSRPALAGAVAGVLAGAVGATFYAAHCPDDSPLFVAVWYTLAIVIVAAAGAVLGSRVLRW